MQSLKPLVAVTKLQNDSVALKDANLVYRACSMAFAQNLGCASPSDVIGKTDSDLLPEHVAQQQLQLDAQTLQSAKADINTIRLGGHTNQTKSKFVTVMIVRTPVLDDAKQVCGIDIRLVGSPPIKAASTAPQVDYGLLMKEGLQGSIIIDDNKVLFATHVAANTLGYDNVEHLQSRVRLNDLFTPEQRIHLSRAALAETADPTRTTRAKVTARRRDGNAVRLITRAVLVTWGSVPAILLSFVETATVKTGAVAGKVSGKVGSTHTTTLPVGNSKTLTNIRSARSSSSTAKIPRRIRQRLHKLRRSVPANHKGMGADSAPQPAQSSNVAAVAQLYKVLGIEHKLLVGRTFQQWIEMPGNLNESAQWEEHIKRLHDRQPFRDVEFRWMVDSETRTFRYSGVPVYNAAKQFKGYRATICDVTSAARNNKAIEYHANHDALTGLVNRRSFESTIEQSLEESRSSRAAHAMCYMDLDGFKSVNDTSGHEAGDELLRQLAQLFNSLVRKSDVLARLGGDEFGVFLFNCRVAEAIKLANQIRHEVEDFQFPWGEHIFSVGVSIGLIVLDDRWENIESAFRAADAACYIAKDEGRNRVVVYREGAGHTSNRKVATQWVEEINSALEENRFRLAVQKILPMVDQPDGERFEAFSRLELPDGSIVNPSSFYPAAERYGLSSALDRRMIEITIRWMSQNEALRNKLRHVSLNLCSGSFTDPEFAGWLIEQVKQSELQPEQFCFELGETVTIANLSAASTFMGKLTSIGCRFSIDHFGSGLSSFGYLRKLPIDFLKIDGLTSLVPWGKERWLNTLSLRSLKRP